MNRRRIALVLWLPLVCLAGAVSSSFARDVVPGDRGYGVTVFQGQLRERFEVEILGSMEGWGSTGNVLLARLSGGPLAETGVMQGMSGSPVYVDGELVGAVMSTWPFAKQAIAGIRPIDEMRQLARDLATEGEGEDGGESAARADARKATQDAGEFVARLAGESVPDGVGALAEPGGLVWNASGFAPSLWPQLENALGGRLVTALQAGGRHDSDTDPATLEGGDALAVILVDGDARLFATGTVTERIGDAVLGFGHPFLSLGQVNLPVARAEVVALLPSEQISFKMARPLQRVGALRVDRRAGICAELGAEADMLPVRIRLRGGTALPARDYSFEVGRMVELTPNLIAWAAQSALLDERQASDEQVARLSLELEVEGGAPLRSEVALAGPGLATQIASEFSLPVAVLQRNPERPVRIESVRADLELRPADRVATIVTAHALDTELVPGEPLRVRVELRPLRDQSRWVELSVDVPDHLAPGNYRLHLGDGARAFREELARSESRWQRLDLRTVREAFELRRPADELVAVLYGRPRSLVVSGVELESLPSTVRTVLSRSEAAPGATAVAATPLARSAVKTEFVLSGAVQLSFTVPEPTGRAPAATGDGPPSKTNGNGNASRDRRGSARGGR